MKQFVLGIDLGTTNSVIAYAPLGGDRAEVGVLDIPQVVAENTIESRRSLPSFCYQAPHSTTLKTLDLPWASDRDYAVGEFARKQGAEAPQRTISAAKSWLSHAKVDRSAAILPWQAPADVAKISPVLASQWYLEHLVQSWDQAFPDASARDQHVVLTVPASFDPVARELTREAAIAAGLPSDLLLLEEPQAAVYAWLETGGESWRQSLRAGDRLLVCDVGGGTTDLTLIGVEQNDGELALRRIAVGSHLLVGGDNMDLALAHFAAGKFAEKGVKLDPWQSVSLWHACRTAKETLLDPSGPGTHTISVLGRGSRLIGGTVSIELDRVAVASLLVDGFMPHCQSTDRPRKERVSGFQEIGLPFEADTAITRRVAAFLAAHASDSDGSRTYPTHVLFNGGVFKAPALRDRLMDVLRHWQETDGGTQIPRSLEGVHDLDFAVARGAAYFGWTRHHGGVRIRGGVARSYYIGMEAAGLAIPGVPRPLRALCVVPFGMEEGTSLDVPSIEVGLVHGEPAEFRFFSSSVRKEDPPGRLLDRWDESELIESTSLHATLPPASEAEESYAPVHFRATITELGVLELWCVRTNGDERWKLEFNVREANSGVASGG